MKLLVADDDKHIRKALAEFGKSRGYEVFKAGRGDVALDIALKDDPDVILLDIMMPGLDGRNVMRKLQAAGKTEDTVIVFISARISKEDEQEGLALGADAYETKPLQLGELFDRLDALVKKKRG